MIKRKLRIDVSILKEEEIYEKNQKNIKKYH